jgi:hypothetical protein
MSDGHLPAPNEKRVSQDSQNSKTSNRLFSFRKKDNAMNEKVTDQVEVAAEDNPTAVPPVSFLSLFRFVLSTFNPVSA